MVKPTLVPAPKELRDAAIEAMGSRGTIPLPSGVVISFHAEPFVFVVKGGDQDDPADLRAAVQTATGSGDSGQAAVSGAAGGAAGGEATGTKSRRSTK